MAFNEKSRSRRAAGSCGMQIRHSERKERFLSLDGRQKARCWRMFCCTFVEFLRCSSRPRKIQAQRWNRVIAVGACNVPPPLKLH